MCSLYVYVRVYSRIYHTYVCTYISRCIKGCRKVKNAQDTSSDDAAHAEYWSVEDVLYPVCDIGEGEEGAAVVDVVYSVFVVVCSSVMSS